MKTFTIHNFRAGFATNSSSTHSVILIPQSMVGKVSAIPSQSDSHYGWDEFRLVTQEDKMRYLAAQFLNPFFEDKAALEKITARFEQELPGITEEVASAEERWDVPSVDHQSAYTFAEFDEEVLEHMITLFKDPCVVVLGGHDNGAPGNNEVRGSDNIPMMSMIATDGGQPYRLRKDGDFLVAFDPGRGTKMRFSVTRGEYVKSTNPELVDLKITDYCAGGCRFCYMSSTTKGKHAPLADIEKILDTLSQMKVFEVALGGGEPTDHPDFGDILYQAHTRNIIPNFTTMSDRWLDDPEKLDMVREFVGGIGVSCQSVKDLERYKRIEAAVNQGRVWYAEKTHVMVQHVIETVPIRVTMELINECFTNGIPLLLLGYKDVGFGASYNTHRWDKSAAAVEIKMLADANKKKASLSVDTAIVNAFPELLGALGVPNALVTSPEGKFSCYIDGVEKVMGPSSYIEKVDMVALAEDMETFQKIYAQW